MICDDASLHGTMDDGSGRILFVLALFVDTVNELGGKGRVSSGQLYAMDKKYQRFDSDSTLR